MSVYSSPSNNAANAQGRRPQKGSRPATAPKPRTDYSKFSHTTHVTKEKLVCASCHKFPTENWKQVRKGEAAFPDVAEFPVHSTCLNCHREQFFARERPAPTICSNCHVNVTPRDTARFVFPSLGDVTDIAGTRRDLVSEFAVNFPHETHLEVVSLNQPPFRSDSSSRFLTASWTTQKKSPPANCPVCHQTYKPQGQSSEEYVSKPPKNIGDAFWLKKGTFQTIPNSHTGCFTCHNADSGIAPTSADCQVCHKLIVSTAPIKTDFDPSLVVTMGVTDSVILNTWRKRISAGAFRHEGGAHPDLVCADCHNPSLMNTVEAKTLRVSVRSCGGAEGCHITTTTAEGGSLNYEIDEKKKNATFVCSKCHITFGKQAVPADHPQAIPTPTPVKKPNLESER
ncbi:MAG TPA: cytochrome c3 family protein [Pyrinomonadaceae bacterium]|jgi:hypothetical protein|nr:cytochrome c3 family protein [Pyrinomonadaceae bacterium]